MHSEQRNTRIIFVVTVVIEINSLQHREVHLILADGPQVGNDGSLQSLGISRIQASLDVVLRHLEVLQILEVAQSSIGNHPVQHRLETVTLEGSLNEHQTRRIRVLQQLHQTRNQSHIQTTGQQHIRVEVRIDGSLVLHLLGQGLVPHFQRQRSHTRESQHTSVGKSLSGIGVTNSQIQLSHGIILHHIPEASSLLFIVAIITQNEGVIDGEPGFRGGRGLRI